jgi:hypothetical protein
MIFCSWCDRPFFDGEPQTIRDLNGTEIPYHCGCFEHWRKNETVLSEIFNEGDVTWETTSTTFERIYRDSQITY